MTTVCVYDFPDSTALTICTDEAVTSTLGCYLQSVLAPYLPLALRLPSLYGHDSGNSLGWYVEARVFVIELHANEAEIKTCLHRAHSRANANT